MSPPIVFANASTGAGYRALLTSMAECRYLWARATVSRIVVNHGQHSIALLNSDDGKPLLVAGNAGVKVFVEVVADIGLFATRFSLRRIAEDEGRHKALASKLIKDVRGISRP